MMRVSTLLPFLIALAIGAALAVEPSATPSMAHAKRLAVAAPRPEYPAFAREHRLGGYGQFVVYIDRSTGLVTSVKTEKSTGVALLDRCAREAFQRWKFKPHTIDKCRIPVNFVPPAATKKHNAA